MERKGTQFNEAYLYTDFMLSSFPLLKFISLKIVDI